MRGVQVVVHREDHEAARGRPRRPRRPARRGVAASSAWSAGEETAAWPGARGSPAPRSVEPLGERQLLPRRVRATARQGEARDWIWQSARSSGERATSTNPARQRVRPFEISRIERDVGKGDRHGDRAGRLPAPGRPSPSWRDRSPRGRGAPASPAPGRPRGWPGGCARSGRACRPVRCSIAAIRARWTIAADVVRLQCHHPLERPPRLGRASARAADSSGRADRPGGTTPRRRRARCR